MLDTTRVPFAFQVRDCLKVCVLVSVCVMLVLDRPVFSDCIGFGACLAGRYTPTTASDCCAAYQARGVCIPGAGVFESVCVVVCVCMLVPSIDPYFLNA